MKEVSFRQKIGLFLASIAPGIFLVGYNIGTGSVTAAAATGAKFGMSLLWPLLLSCIFTYILILAFGRYTAVSGKTALSSYRTHFGTTISATVLISLVVSEWVGFMGVMGIVTEVIQEWSRPLTASGNGISPISSAAVIGIFIYLLFWTGVHRFFENILVFFVMIMGMSFIVTAFMVIPDPIQVIQGLFPRFPEGTSEALLVAGMVGTTMGGILYVVRSILVQEKGWTVNDLAIQNRDAFVSSFLMFTLSAAIMACAAGTLFPRGLEVENSIDMVKLLEPLAGRFAVSIFVAGIVSAGISSLFPHILFSTYFAGPMAACRFSKSTKEYETKAQPVDCLFTVSLGFVVPVFGGRPVLVMIVSQVLAAIATPVVVFLMLILLNKKEVMGDRQASRSFNIIMGLIFLFTLFMAATGIHGIRGLL